VIRLAGERLGAVDSLVNNADVAARSEPFQTHSRDLFE
jgi:hypothetical protein